MFHKLFSKFHSIQFHKKEVQFEKADQDKATLLEQNHSSKKYPAISLENSESNATRKSSNDDPSAGFSTNELITHRYTLLNFLPKNLFEQFRRISNVYFTLIVVIAFIPQISPISPSTGLAGLVFVLLVAAINEGYMDYKRYKNDKKVNREEHKIIDNDGKLKSVQSQDIRVGDLVYIEADEAFPADLVVLATSLPHGLCYIETAQLDGETNLKDRKTVDLLPAQRVERKSKLRKKQLIKEVLSLQGDVECSMPSTQLDNFLGALNLSPNSLRDLKVRGPQDPELKDVSLTDQSKDKIPLTVNQLLLRGANLKHTKWIIGVAVYCGRDTKYALNQSLPSSKFSSIEAKLNKIVTALFICQISLCLLAAFFSYEFEDTLEKGHYYLALEEKNTFWEAFKNFWVYFVLLSWVIPMSLFVCLEMAKVVQGYFMENDIEMALDPNNVDETGMKVRNNGLNDELGVVKFIFSDKTGTLTRNVMKFKKCTIGGFVYNVPLLCKQLGTSEIQEETKEDELNKEEASESADSKDGPKNHINDFIHNFLLCATLCHTAVVDVVKEPEETEDNESIAPSAAKEEEEESLVNLDDNAIEYKAQSPDEEALLNAARSVGYILKENKPRSLVLKVKGDIVEYSIVRVLAFSSDRRRMSVVVRTPEKKLLMFTKGADSAMLDLLSNKGKVASFVLDQTNKHMDLFSKDGYRTLVLAYKELDESSFKSWDAKCKEAEALLEDRQNALDKLYEEVENNLELLGCSAIEDKLADEVPETIDYILKAGITLWVITGDKQETAINIGRSSNLIPKQSKVLKLNAGSYQECVFLLETMSQDAAHGSNGGSCLATDGNTLKLILKHRDLRAQFLDLVKHCKSVICSRVTPLIKAKVVRLVKNYTNACCLAIGDGSNDVSMIQEASIGVGVFGKEGTQAARSADYAIREFRHLKRLLVVHGRYCLIRNSALIHYSIYKNVAFALAQYWFVYWCAFSGQRIYNDWMMLFFNLFYTSIPSVFIGIFEKDITENAALHHPKLYKLLRSGYVFNYATSLLWFLAAVWHSIVFFATAYLIFRNDILWSNGQNGGIWSFGTMVQTFAVVVVLLKIAIETKYWVWPVAVGIFGSIILYFVLLVGLSFYYQNFSDDYFVFESILQSPQFLFGFLLVIIASLLPDLTHMFFTRAFFPRSWEIVQEESVFGSPDSSTKVLNETDPLLKNHVQQISLA